jgi:hypothetical protein
MNFTYALISQTQSPGLYYVNEDLGFTRTHHADFNYFQHLSESMKLTVGAFYQSLFDVPVTTSPSEFSALNVMDEIIVTSLENAGTGTNYGVDITAEKYFFTSTYLLLSGSYYESKYKGSDDVERDTRFNGNYTFSGAYGKEWKKSAKARTIGLNSRLLYLGGLREPNYATSAGPGLWYYTFDTKLPDYFRIDLRFSIRKDKPTHTRTIAIDIQNLLNTQNESHHYYDTHQGKTVTKYQLGIIPVLVYRIDF